MILREATIRFAGYDSDELKLKSAKRICCSCDNCGRVRWSPKQGYRDLCGSCSQSGKVLSNKIRQKISKSSMGKIISEETRQKISESKKGIIFTKEHCDKIGKGNKGKIISKETKIKISKAGKGRIVSEETKQKIGDAQKGKLNHNWKGGFDKKRSWLLPKDKCIKLNNKIIGFDAHHIMSGVIIYLPYNLHRSIRHEMKTSKNMNEINELAYNYLRGEF